MYVKACSGPGAVRVARPDFSVNLAPGHELLLSNSRPSKTDMNPADGVGRRKADVKELNDGTHAVVSDFAMITLIKNLDGLRNAKTAVERKIVERMLRTAAAINLATGGRGVYSSKSKPNAPAKPQTQQQYAGPDSVYKPVALKSSL